MLYNIDINKMNKLMSNNEDARQIIPQLLRNHRNTISTISHEIRNPLTLVSSALQVMEKQNPELKDIPHWSQVMGTRLHSSGSFPQRRYHYHHLYRYRLRNHSGADGMYLPAICHLQTGRNRTWTGILPQDCRGSRRNSHCCFHSAGIHYIYRYTSCLGTFLP